jgi:hypothetical protein
MPWQRRHGSFKDHTTLLVIVFGSVLCFVVLVAVFQEQLWNLMMLTRYGLPSAG